MDVSAPLRRSSESADPTANRSPGFFANLFNGLRLALFLPPRPLPEPTWTVLIGLIAASVVAPFLVQLAIVGRKGSFTLSGLPGLLFELPVLILGAWVLARLAGRPERTLTLLVALVAIAIPISGVFATALAMLLPERQSELVYLAPSWVALAATIAAIRLLPIPQSRWAAAFMLAGVTVAWPLGAIDTDVTMWWAPATEEHPVATFDFHGGITEETFHLQPKLLEEQLAALAPGQPGAVHLYFIGVAPYARQDVFMKEVRMARKLFDDRFDTRGRSLELINNRATARQVPLATATNLRTALKRVAQVMGDDDILFLFITSHGSRQQGATFEFWPLELQPVDPPALKAMLDEAGIKRRVVVVSACYSGAYVDALAGDDTLVMSASAAERRSFGCSDDADLTYFGKAYFDDALRRTFSFTVAFEMARSEISDREHKSNFASSDPKISVGRNIGPVLEKLASSLAASSP